MKIRSKAPLRLGFAGGGTDVSPYSDIFGGAVLNVTINLFATTFIEKLETYGTTYFYANDLELSDALDLTQPIGINGNLLLHRAVYKRVMEEFNGGVYTPLKVTTQCDAPPGSGLGSSSAVVVSMLEGYKQLLSLPLGEYDLAKLAYEIERVDCGLSGGKQDQYASTFGGFNFIEFGENNNVIVNPLRIRRHIANELESSIIMFFSGVSRDSATIINDQINTLDTGGSALESMHLVKASAYRMKELLLRGDIEGMAVELKDSWKAKKATSSSISNSHIDELEHKITESGALSMKISGAGGGGFIMIFVKPEAKAKVVKKLSNLEGQVVGFNFNMEGALSWTI
jgi:D-glycero-alpha-D-manno-heptose-7-phosphate kinase